MSTFVNVSTEKLSRDISSMSGEIDSIERELTSLYESVNLLGTMWSGAAHDEFLRQFENDRTNVLENINSIREYLEDMQECKTEYEKCDQSVNSMVQSL